MPFNKLNITLSPAQEAAIQAAIDALRTNLPFGINLTKEERVELPNLQDERLSFVTKIIEDYAPANPGLVSGFAGTLADAQTDFTLYNQLRNFISQLKPVVEMYEDTQQVAGSEDYTFGREFYASAQRGAANNYPGANEIADDLGNLFDEQGQQQPPPPEPPPVP